MQTWSKITAAATAACFGVLIAGTAANAAEVVLMTTGAVEQIMKGLIPSFEKASGHKVTMTVLGTGPAVAKIKEGTFADLILLGPDAHNELAAAGKVNTSTITMCSARASGLRCGPARRSPTSDAGGAEEDAARREVDRLQHRPERRILLQGRDREARHRQ